jgi:hypothetical protein
MSVAYIQEFNVEPGNRSTTNYDAVAGRIGDVRPEGLLIHTAGFDGDVFRIFDVWESREQAQRFIDEQLMPIINELMDAQVNSDLQPPQREAFYDLHDVVNP